MKIISTYPAKIKESSGAFEATAVLYRQAVAVFVKILQKNLLGGFLPLDNLSRGFAPTLRYPRIFIKHE